VVDAGPLYAYVDADHPTTSGLHADAVRPASALHRVRAPGRAGVVIYGVGGKHGVDTTVDVASVDLSAAFC